MFMNEIILKKRHKEVLNEDEITFFIQEYTKGNIPDYQASALLMAIVLNGMNAHETSLLTKAMMHSGDIIDLSKIAGIKVDKHSTGGVGDKTSLVLGPLVAACGVKVAKMSGRGLGHTGGTLDKMEAIPGMKVQLSIDQFIQQVNKIGIAIIGQSSTLVPADKKLYALRDVTGTVDSIALISSSIMSKKLATGSDCILLDVKFGSGAFFEDPQDAKKLAQAMVNIGKNMHRDTRAILTNMDQPLGLAIGNALEIQEVIATLNGQGPEDLVELCLQAGTIMLKQAKVVNDDKEAYKMLQGKIADGSALKKLQELVIAQGGDVSYITNPTKFPRAKHIVEVHSQSNGYVCAINAHQLGEIAMKIGAGRAKKEDSIDYAAGIIVTKKCGDFVNAGDVIAVFHTNIHDYSMINEAIQSTFTIKDQTKQFYPIIYDIIQ